MGRNDNSSDNSNLEKQNANQANTIATLENELEKKSDPNGKPIVIQKGSQLHPKYQRNKIKITATLPKETPKDKPKKE